MMRRQGLRNRCSHSSHAAQSLQRVGISLHRIGHIGVPTRLTPYMSVCLNGIIYILRKEPDVYYVLCLVRSQDAILYISVRC